MTQPRASSLARANHVRASSDMRASRRRDELESYLAPASDAQRRKDFYDRPEVERVLDVQEEMAEQVRRELAL